MRPKEDYQPRNIILNLRVNKEESELINQKFKNSGYKSKSDFIRMMIFQGKIIKVSDDTLKDFRQKLNSISNNFNQIAVRVNSTGNLYAEDLAEIKKGMQEIWQQQRYFQSLLLSIKPSPTLPTEQRPKTES